jgi:hypothetical protein
MSEWLIAVIVMGSIIFGLVLYHMFLHMKTEAFMDGVEQGERTLRSALGLPDPDEVEQHVRSKLSSKVQTPTSLIFERYELLFDLDIAGYLSSGVMAPKWISLVDHVKYLVDEKFDEFPPDTNTVIVRSIKIHKNGQGEFVFEPMCNPNLCNNESVGEQNAN